MSTVEWASKTVTSEEFFYVLLPFFVGIEVVIAVTGLLPELVR